MSKYDSRLLAAIALFCVVFIASAFMQVGQSPGVTGGSSSNGGSGVSSVSGTPNEIDVATGSTTPVISFDPAFASGGLSFFGNGSTTSAQLAALLSDELGTGKAIFSAGTLSVASGKTLTVSNSLTFAGTDGITGTTPTTSFTMARTDAAQTFAGNQTFSTGISAKAIQTASNCSTVGTTTVACGTAAAGAFSCSTAASGTTCVVAETGVTANSEIIVKQTATLNTRLSVTCNTNSVLPSGAVDFVTSFTAGTGFTITLGTFTTNPPCFEYYVVN